MYANFRARPQDEKVAIFNLVAPRDNWKRHINATVTGAQMDAVGTSPEEVLIAIGYFTGSCGEYYPLQDGWRFTAPGYYASVGA